MEALNDPVRRVRATAAWALGSLELEQAPPALVKAMQDDDDEVRLRAAWAISQIGDAAAMPAVAKALRAERSADVRKAQIRALMESGQVPDDALKGLAESDDADMRRLAVQAAAGRMSPWPWPWPEPRPRPFP